MSCMHKLPGLENGYFRAKILTSQTLPLRNVHLGRGMLEQGGFSTSEFWSENTVSSQVALALQNIKYEIWIPTSSLQLDLV